MVTPEIRVVVTGDEWMGSGLGSIESAIHDIFQAAVQEIIMTAYSVSPSTDRMFNWLEGALARGVKVTLVVNEFSQQPDDVQASLRLMSGTYGNFVLLDFRGDTHSALHAKVILADRKIALVGSSNISERGFLRNFELAVVVQGDGTSRVGQAMDALVQSRYVESVSL